MVFMHKDSQEMKDRRRLKRQRGAACRWFSVIMASSIPLLVNAGHTSGLRGKTPEWYTEPHQRRRIRKRGMDGVQLPYGTYAGRSSQRNAYSVLRSARESPSNMFGDRPKSRMVTDDEDCADIRRGSVPSGLTEHVSFILSMNVTFESGGEFDSIAGDLQKSLQVATAFQLAGCDGTSDGDNLLAIFFAPQQKNGTGPCSAPERSTDAVEGICVVAETAVDVYSVDEGVGNVGTTLTGAVTKSWNAGLLRVPQLQDIAGVTAKEGDLKASEPSGVQNSPDAEPPNNDEESSGDDGFLSPVFIVSVSVSATALLLLATIWIKRRKHRRGRSRNIEDENQDKPTMAEEVEVRTWFSLKDQFSDSGKKLFQLPVVERLRQHPNEIKAWLQLVHIAWNEPAGDDEYEELEKKKKQDVRQIEDVGDDISYDSLAAEIEVLTWFSLKDAFPPKDAAFFDVPAEDMLKRDSQEIKSWLRQVKTAWDQNNAEKASVSQSVTSSRRSSGMDNVIIDMSAIDHRSSDEETAEDDDSSMVKEIEVRTWFSLQQEFQPLDESLFVVPPEKLLQKHPSEVDDWLDSVQAAWDSYQQASELCDDTTVEDDGKLLDLEEFSTVKQIEVRTWYSLQDEFQALDKSLFEQSPDDILKKDTNEVNAWLSKVQAEWDEYEKSLSDPLHGEDVSDSSSGASKPKEAFGEIYDPVVQQMEVQTLYSIQGEFHAFDESLFDVSVSERLKQRPSDVQAWLAEVKRAWDEYEKTHAEQLSGDEQDLHSNVSSMDGDDDFDPMVKEIEVRTWFSIQDEFHAFDDSLFKLCAEERLNQKPSKVNAWLQEVQTAWDVYQNTSSTLSQDVDDGEDDDSHHSSENGGNNATVNEIEVRTWFSVQNEFHALDDSLFEISAEERLQQPPQQINFWLREVQRAWAEYEKSQSSTTTTAVVSGAVGKTVSDSPSKSNRPQDRSSEAASKTSSSKKKAPKRKNSNSTLSSTSRKTSNTSSSSRSSNSAKASHARSGSKDFNKTASRTVATAATAAAVKAVASGEDSGDETDDSMVKEIEVRTWFSLQDEFHAFDESLFKLSPEERLQQPTRKIKAWLRKVEAAWDKYQRTHFDDVDDSDYSTVSIPDAAAAAASTALNTIAESPPRAAPKTAAKPRLKKAASSLSSKSNSRSFSRSASRVSSADSDDSSEGSMVKEIEVRTWFSLQDEFHAFDRALFEMPADERLQQSPAHIEAWLQRVQHAWDRYESKAGLTYEENSESEELSDDNGYDTMVKDIEVRTWFSLQDEFQALDKSLFELSADERLQQDPEEIRDWLKEVQAAWNAYEKDQSGEERTETTGAPSSTTSSANTNNTSLW